jgi:hypothetical protein
MSSVLLVIALAETRGSINRFAEKSGFVTLPRRIPTQDEGSFDRG